MTLMGRAAWWLPAPVGRVLPKISVEGEEYFAALEARGKAVIARSRSGCLLLTYTRRRACVPADMRSSSSISSSAWPAPSATQVSGESASITGT